mmetsp:Transcript_45753/g.108472  ORF Transcript_45753/g.108472 Transcript_45753/m.108472 type:complete len:278 (+) Transcript_45753:256-1089(+)
MRISRSLNSSILALVSATSFRFSSVSTLGSSSLSNHSFSHSNKVLCRRVFSCRSVCRNAFSLLASFKREILVAASSAAAKSPHLRASRKFLPFHSGQPFAASSSSSEAHVDRGLPLSPRLTLMFFIEADSRSEEYFAVSACAAFSKSLCHSPFVDGNGLQFVVEDVKVSLEERLLSAVELRIERFMVLGVVDVENKSRDSSWRDGLRESPSVSGTNPELRVKPRLVPGLCSKTLSDLFLLSENCRENMKLGSDLDKGCRPGRFVLAGGGRCFFLNSG